MSTKYFCKVCRLYIDDNKAQRLQHENGSKHRDAVEKSRAVAREQKLEVLANERKLAQTLQGINRAARKDLSIDKDESTLLAVLDCLPIPLSFMELEEDSVEL